MLKAALYKQLTQISLQCLSQVSQFPVYTLNCGTEMHDFHFRLYSAQLDQLMPCTRTRSPILPPGFVKRGRSSHDYIIQKKNPAQTDSIQRSRSKFIIRLRYTHYLIYHSFILFFN